MSRYTSCLSEGKKVKYLRGCEKGVEAYQTEPPSLQRPDL